MTIVAAAEPLFAPPRNTINVALPAGSVMSAVSVWRNLAGVKTPLRSQPAAGFDSRTVYDYECPYGVAVTYGWSATYTDPTAYTTLWNETWANLSSWVVEDGTWTVSSGKARSGTGGGFLSRAVTPGGKYRVTLDSLSNPPAVPGAFSVGVAFYQAPAVVAFSVQRRVGGAIYITSEFLDVVTTINPALPIVVDINATTVRIWNAGGSYTLNRPTTISKIALVDFSVSAGMLWGPIKVQAYPAPTVVTETSAPVTLTPADGWLVHPASPGLSFRMQRGDTSYAELVELGDVDNESNATVHSVLGSSLPITVSNGDRAGDVTAIDLRAYTAQAVADLLAAVRDEVPLLVSFPPGWSMDFKFAFYQVGNVRRAHTVKSSRYPYREINLPLTEVESPLVDVADTGWSYAAVAVEFATYADLVSTFATYADLASNIRS